jgi:hypothetical protein
MNFSNGPHCSTILKGVLLKWLYLKTLTMVIEGWWSCHYYITPTSTTWHKSHHLPLHNSSALLPAHKPFKWPSYIWTYLYTVKITQIIQLLCTSITDLHKPWLRHLYKHFPKLLFGHTIKLQNIALLKRLTQLIKKRKGKQIPKFQWKLVRHNI